jgi:predicted membrane-bound mannosyltransferase
LGVALAAAYLGTRLWRLGALPMFSDEGTYLTWGLRALHAGGAADLLASVPDGKQPLLPWLMVPFLALVPDRLLAARLTAVAAGAAGAVDSTALRARGGEWHRKHRLAGVVPHTAIDTEAGWTRSGWHGWVYGWKLHLVP